MFMPGDLRELEGRNNRPTYMYEIANYSKMKGWFHIDWDSCLPHNLSTEEKKWEKFSGKLTEVVKEHLPKKLHTKYSSSRKGPTKIYHLIKQKQRLWKKKKTIDEHQSRYKQSR